MCRYRSQLCVLLALVMTVHVITASGSAFAQGTPEQDLTDDIQFAIIPVGDYPNGYFDDVPVDPGEAATFEVDLVNASDLEIPFNVYVANANSAVNGGFVSGREDDELAGPALWIDFDQRAVVLGPNSVKRVSFTVTVPEKTAPGQYIAAMAMDMQESFSIPGTDALTQKLSYAISIGLLVPGELHYSFELGEPEFLLDSSSIVIPVTNTGNYLVKPQGEIVILDSSGTEVMRTTIQMGSIYGGLETFIGIGLPEQFESTELSISIDLVDPASGAFAKLADAVLVIPDQQNPSTLVVENATITPNGEDIVFANVDITLLNNGSQLPAVNVNLVVLHVGAEVDSFPLATNQVLLTGTNVYTSRYIPATEWESGTYTFRLEVYSVDPNGGSEMSILSEDLDLKLVVP